MFQSTSDSLPRPVLVSGAFAIGLFGDLLLNGSDGPGLNLFLLFVLLAGVIVAVVRSERRAAGRSGGRAGSNGARIAGSNGGRIADSNGGRVAEPSEPRLSIEAWGWIAIGLALALALVLRASESLQFLAFIMAAVVFTFPALRTGRAWLGARGVSGPVEALAASVLSSALGPFRSVLGGDRGPGLGTASRPHAHAGSRPDAHAGSRPESRPESHPTSRRLWGVLRGVLYAIPPLFVFGALFMAADPVFEALILRQLGSLEIDEVVSHIVLVGVLTWFAIGYLTGFVSGSPLERWVAQTRIRPTLSVLEVGTVLGLVAALFAAFVAVQFQTLFGGHALVEVTPGLTYAEYARKGFGQLVVVAALVLPLLLAADFLTRNGGEKAAERRTFRGLAGLQIGLLFVVIASALHRMQAYQDAYGLTESRVYGTVFLGWIACVSLWFGWTVIRGRQRHFTSVALGSAVAIGLTLIAANPDARIAASNLDRGSVEGDAERGGEPASGPAGSRVDAAYLASLSADAVPTLVRALGAGADDRAPAFSLEDRCTLQRALIKRWHEAPARDWRGWNASEARARRVVQEARLAGVLSEDCSEL